MPKVNSYVQPLFLRRVLLGLIRHLLLPRVLIPEHTFTSNTTYQLLADTAAVWTRAQLCTSCTAGQQEKWLLLSYYKEKGKARKHDHGVQSYDWGPDEASDIQSSACVTCNVPVLCFYSVTRGCFIRVRHWWLCCLQQQRAGCWWKQMVSAVPFL